jgi:hypothetical protein
MQWLSCIIMYVNRVLVELLSKTFQVVSCGSLAPSTPSVEWEEKVGRNLRTLVNSKTFAQMRGAILAIGIISPLLLLLDDIDGLLIDVILEIIKEDPLDNRVNLFRFYNHLTTILRETRDTNILTGASWSLGRLAQISGTVLGEHFLEEQIPYFLEMEADSPFSTVLALKELARHSATSFFPHLANAFLSVWRLLRHQQVYCSFYDFLRRLMAVPG